VFTARYELIPYVNSLRFASKMLMCKILLLPKQTIDSLQAIIRCSRYKAVAVYIYIYIYIYIANKYLSRSRREKGYEVLSVKFEVGSIKR